MPEPQAPTEPRLCLACRETGKVISNLGGEPHTETCPWCEGSRVQVPGHDAQAARRGDVSAA